jgi:hypothetical protein
MPKAKISELDPCLPRPGEVMTPAELVAWERRLRHEKAEEAGPGTEKSSEED